MSPDDEYLLNGLVHTVQILAATKIPASYLSHNPPGGEVAQLELETLLYGAKR